MQFGLFMMPLHPPERSFTESYDRDLAQIVWQTGWATTKSGSASI